GAFEPGVIERAGTLRRVGWRLDDPEGSGGCVLDRPRRVGVEGVPLKEQRLDQPVHLVSGHGRAPGAPARRRQTWRGLAPPWLGAARRASRSAAPPRLCSGSNARSSLA